MCRLLAITFTGYWFGRVEYEKLKAIQSIEEWKMSPIILLSVKHGPFRLNLK